MAFAAGCGTDLGECDMVAAQRIVYRAGIPYYEGQALVETHCAGGSFCHTAKATGVARLGVPAGLDFDVAVVTPGMSVEDALRHGDGWDTIDEWAEPMLAEVRAGRMPPGEAGKRLPETWYHEAPDGTLPTGGANELFDVRSAQGEEILRNWLACGHRTVTGTTDLEGDVRASVQALGGAVLSRRDLQECVPIGSVVYEQLLSAGGCIACHTPNSPFFPDHLLDLSRDPDGALTAAYAAVFNQPARGEQCFRSGLKLIDPGSCETSLLYQKLAAVPDTTGEDGVCGGVMPVGRSGPFDAELLACLCEWIDGGAPAL